MARWSPATAHRSIRTITIKAFSPTQPGLVTNTAFVDPNNTIPEGDETDNHDTANTPVVVAAAASSTSP